MIKYIVVRCVLVQFWAETIDTKIMRDLRITLAIIPLQY